MQFIKLHWFEKDGSCHKIEYKGEIAISVDEITYVNVSEFNLSKSDINVKDKEFLYSINKEGNLSIVHTKIFELPEILVIETVRDIFDFIR